MKDFSAEIREKYPEKECVDMEQLIEAALDHQESALIHSDIWSLSLDVEKIHALQYTYYLNLSKETSGDDEEISLIFENGINNGTALIEYSMDGANSLPIKTVNVLTDIKIDWSRINDGANKKLVEAVFNYHKPEILDIYKKQNYDNYVTGGGTNKTNSHYKQKKDIYHKMGLYWELVYEEIEVDRTFV